MKTKNNDYGEVTFEGKVYQLTQDAYCDNYGIDGEVRYTALATDIENKEYEVMWKTTEEWNNANNLFALIEELEVLNSQKSYDDGEIIRMTELEAMIEEMESKGISSNCEDESSACDWDNPISVELL